MRIGGLIILAFSILLSCNRIQSEITADELEDKHNYTGGMLVDCSSLGGSKIERLVLNNSEQSSIESIDLRSPGYYRLEFFTHKSGDAAPAVIRVVILDPERGETEWGLDKWIPKGIQTGSLGGEEIKVIHPPKVPAEFSYPIVLVAGGGLTKSLINLKAKVGSNDFLIKRGVGSAWVEANGTENSILTVDQKVFPLQTMQMEAEPILLSGNMEEDMEIPAGSFVSIPADLHVPDGLSLSIGQGSFIIIDKGVNIHSSGELHFRGTEEEPISLTCSDEASYWGGVIGTGSGNRIEASHTIFCKSGFHTGENYDYGHAKRQALFYNEGGTLVFNNCYMIDHAGQVFYPRGARLEINFCLIQRAITGGQANYSDVYIDHSVFTDFPDDRRIFQDRDNDAFYLAACDAHISNSIFMYAVDDGLDSGGSEGGEVHVSNTRFESIFHEGAALSSEGSVLKHHYFTSCLFTDCGQGLELGFSSSNHTVWVDSCSFMQNGIGIRYGDNYDWTHKGSLFVSNTDILQSRSNDVWNMVRELWEADTAKMAFTNVRISKANPVYPQLFPYE